MEKLEQYLREKIDYKNKMHDFDLGTETLKIWLDDFKALSQHDVSRCFGEDDLRHVYEDVDTNWQSGEGIKAESPQLNIN